MRFPFLLLAALLLPLSAVSQKTLPTTDAEYNYGAVGYKIQLNAKLETKPGYSMRDMEGCEESERKIEFKAVYRDGEQTPCFVIMVYTRLRTPPMYYCIPTPDANPALWDKFNKSLTAGTDNPADQLQFFTLCISRLMMQYAELTK
jgi:hypothetical protein